MAEWSVHAPHSPAEDSGMAMLADGALSVRARGSSTLPWPHPTLSLLLEATARLLSLVL